jgi:hypothetical protein
MSVQQFVDSKMKDDPNADPAEILNQINWSASIATLIRNSRFFLAKSYVQLSLQRYMEVNNILKFSFFFSLFFFSLIHHVCQPQHLLVKFGPLKLAGKMMKNPSTSAMRKARRFGRVRASHLMVDMPLLLVLLMVMLLILNESYLRCSLLHMQHVCLMYHR